MVWVTLGAVSEILFTKSSAALLLRISIEYPTCLIDHHKEFPMFIPSFLAVQQLTFVFTAIQGKKLIEFFFLDISAGLQKFVSVTLTNPKYEPPFHISLPSQNPPNGPTTPLAGRNTIASSQTSPLHPLIPKNHLPVRMCESPERRRA